MELRINPEYEELLPKLYEKEYESLRESIKNEGLWFPIDINENSVILDGHHRYQICLELDIEPKTRVRKFDSVLLEKLFVIDSNLKRRHLNRFQRSELGIVREPVEAERAKQRQGTRTDLGQTLPSIGGKVVENRHSRESSSIAAQAVSVSPTTYYRAKKLSEKASEKTKEKLRRG